MRLKKLIAVTICGAMLFSGSGFMNFKAMAQEVVQTEEGGQTEDSGNTEEVEITETVEKTEVVEQAETAEKTEAFEQTDSVEQAGTVKQTEAVEQTEAAEQAETAEKTEAVEQTETSEITEADEISDEDYHGDYEMDIAIADEELLGDSNSNTDSSNYATITYTTNVSVTSKDAILKRINEIRMEAYKEGLIDKYTPIKWSSDLEEIAFQRAAESTVLWGHIRPDGTSCFTCRAASGAGSRGEIIASPSDELYSIELWYSEKEDFVKKTGKVTGHYEELIFSNYIGIASCGVTVGETAYYQQGTENQKCTSGKKTVSIKVSKDNLEYFDLNYDGVDSDGSLTLGLGTIKTINPVLTANNGWVGRNDIIRATGTYTSNDKKIATVDNNGNVTGVSKGNTTITFTDGPISMSFNVNVKDYIEMHRLYNPNSGEHFYTASTAEKNHLVSVGWKYEGIGWKAPASSNTPVYRLYNPNAGDHHYTMNKSERDHLISVGWNDEGIGWYSDDAKGVPLYRQYNPNAVAGSHNYTINKAENDHLASIGWNAEGVGWYGVK